MAAQRGTSVAAKAYARLRQVLGQAVDDDRIAKNACRIKKARRRAPSRAALRLAGRSSTSWPGRCPERFRALILTAGLAGLRQGELLALRRRDVDVLRSSIAVRRKRLRLASGAGHRGRPQERGWPAPGRAPGPAGGRARAAPPHVLSAPRRRRLRLHLRSGGPARREQLPIPGVEPGHRLGRPRRAPVPRLARTRPGRWPPGRAPRPRS